MKKVKKESNLPLIIYSIIVVPILLITTYYIYSKYLSLKTEEEKPFFIPLNVTNEKIKEALSLDEYEKVINFTLIDRRDSTAVHLKTKCYVLEGFIDQVQANSIRIALNQTKRIRPTTHDLMKDIFDSFGINYVVGKIIGISGQNYLGLLVLSLNNESYVILDARPSDIMAIALRYNQTVYISKKLLEERGNYTC
ncbi:MAG: DUF151 domain-containing protein [Candidatus Aenigmatarchaeota archaeon]